MHLFSSYRTPTRGDYLPCQGKSEKAGSKHILTPKHGKIFLPFKFNLVKKALHLKYFFNKPLLLVKSEPNLSLAGNKHKSWHARSAFQWQKPSQLEW